MMEKRPVIKDDEIDLAALANSVFSKRKRILKIMVVFGIVGLIFGITSKTEYEAGAKLLPESQENSLPDLGGFGGLAGLAGFDLSSISGGSQDISPELFPEIIKSTPFLDELINELVYFEKLDTTISSFYYFKELDRPSLIGVLAEYSIGLPGKIKKLIIGDQKPWANELAITRYSKDDWEIIEDFSERLFVEYDDESGIISIKSEMPDPLAAAQVSQQMVEELTRYLIEYKIGKSKLNLEFVEEQFNKAESTYQDKQSNVARFSNQNQNVTNALVEAEYQRLQNEMDIAFEVYKGLASQLEQAKIQVNQETPVFTILEPIRIPEDKSNAGTLLFTIGFVFFGFIVGIGKIVLSEIFNAMGSQS